jgi:hypothetical protein
MFERVEMRVPASDEDNALTAVHRRAA